MRSLVWVPILFLAYVIAAAQPHPSVEARSDKQKEAALYLLKTAEAEANGFDGPMKAAVLFALTDGGIRFGLGCMFAGVEAHFSHL